MFTIMQPRRAMLGALLLVAAQTALTGCGRREADMPASSAASTPSQSVPETQPASAASR